MRAKCRRIAALLASYGGPEPERVRAAIVGLADGDEDEVRVLVAAARTDYRDILAWDERRRTGRCGPTLGPERIAELTEWAGGTAAPAADDTGPPTDVVVLDPGPRSPELLKTIRVATGLGLADVADLLDRPPARVAAGLSPAAAQRLRSALEAAGATAELRSPQPRR